MKTKLLIPLIAALLLAGCATKTPYGPCIGALDTKNPKLEYKLSIWNTVIAVMFSEMIVPPVVVIASEAMCPVGVKKQ
jgi:hypothetical protein